MADKDLSLFPLSFLLLPAEHDALRARGKGGLSLSLCSKELGDVFS